MQGTREASQAPRAFDRAAQGAGDEGFELKLVIDPAGGPVRITVVD